MMKKPLNGLILVLILVLFIMPLINAELETITVTVSADKSLIYVGDKFNLIVTLDPNGKEIYTASLTFKKDSNNFDFFMSDWTLDALQKTGNIFPVLGSNQLIGGGTSFTMGGTPVQTPKWFMSGNNPLKSVLSDQAKVLGKIPVIAMDPGGASPGELKLGLVTTNLESQVIKSYDEYFMPQGYSINYVLSPIVINKNVCGDNVCTGQEDSPSCCKDCGCGNAQSCILAPGDPTGHCINDKDGDKVPDESDAFPEDPTEWVDSDGDGVGDNTDKYPNDPTKWKDVDTDLDGINDDDDLCQNSNQYLKTYYSGAFFETGSFKGCLKGDINKDNKVDGSDINPFIIDYRKSASGQNFASLGDINGDGEVDGSDINPFIIHYRLNNVNKKG